MPFDSRNADRRITADSREPFHCGISILSWRSRARLSPRPTSPVMDDRRPLGSRFQDTNKQTRSGGGLPEGSIIPAGITHDLVLQFDLPARKAEREERLLAFNNGDVNGTLWEISEEGGGKDARFLLAHGADANFNGERQERGRIVIYFLSALQSAAFYGRLAVVEALLDAGADLLEFALLEAAGGGHTAVVALLLDRGADVHHDEDCALWNAVFTGQLETAILLLDRGANPNPVPPAGGILDMFLRTGTLLETARERGHHEMVALLLARGAAA